MQVLVLCSEFAAEWPFFVKTLCFLTVISCNFSIQALVQHSSLWHILRNFSTCSAELTEIVKRFKPFVDVVSLKQSMCAFDLLVEIVWASACQPGVSYTPGCTRIFQGCTNFMGCTGLYLMCAIQEQSQDCPTYVLCFSADVLTFHRYLSGRMHCLSFPTCLYVMLVR